MLELDNALGLIIKGIDATVSEFGFKVEYPEGVRPPELPKAVEGDKTVIMYRGEKGRIRIEYSEGRLALFCAGTEDASLPDDGLTRTSLSLLELDTFDERDIKYILEEYAETITTAFGSKKAQGKQKLPTPVSKSAAKSGALSYDLVTLGSRFVGIYQQLKEPYKKNIETYGEFLAEEFFEDYGCREVVGTLRSGDKVQIRKLFNLLNDIYEDGTNETQGLIAVTLLGQLYTEPELFELAKDYMSETMAPPVEEVVKYLASGKSKGAKMRLKNPPAYKPPKKKKQKGMLSQMLGM